MTKNPAKEFLTLPNLISLFRIAATPVIVIMLIDPDKGASFIATLIFLVVCLTDWLDGFLARRLKSVTSLGKFLDPLADKILIVSVLVMLVELDRVPAWIVAAILAREFAVTGLRSVAVDSGIVIQASPLGKLKTVTQIAGIAPLVLHYKYFGIDFHAAGTVILWFALVFTLWSGIDYFVKFFRSGEKAA
ncbi:MAG: CDP-diacylglycerol--glycerol-3-phosphate 3-phosphatidyltransferase [Deltaproteobacteria bacterium]|nr:CDP-diacylglycerol--glycerol-3-phosphate 3-phosphatidyltransferase [Deltaproteobacteria bacterium]